LNYFECGNYKNGPELESDDYFKSSCFIVPGTALRDLAVHRSLVS